MHDQRRENIAAPISVKLIYKGGDIHQSTARLFARHS